VTYAEREQLLDRVQRKAEALCALDEAQPRQRMYPESVRAGSDRGRRGRSPMFRVPER
jgi:hypothetical protein